MSKRCPHIINTPARLCCALRLAPCARQLPSPLCVCIPEGAGMRQIPAGLPAGTGAPAGVLHALGLEFYSPGDAEATASGYYDAAAAPALRTAPAAAPVDAALGGALLVPPAPALSRAGLARGAWRGATALRKALALAPAPEGARARRAAPVACLAMRNGAEMVVALAAAWRAGTCGC